MEPTAGTPRTEQAGTTRRLAGRYEVFELLGEGGMSRVYRGRDLNLGRDVAVKIPRSEVLSDQDALGRFFREGRAAASLNHPNIVRLYDFVNSDDPGPFLVMELIGGDDLRRRLALGPLDAAEAVRVARQVLAALSHAHEQGLVHRDLSARNVLLDAAGNVHVSDFGIARALGDQTLTRTGEMVGSVSYMAPEQAQGQEAGPTADLYAVGVLLFEMLTGRLPYQGDTPVQVALKHIQEPVPAPSSLRPGLPEGLDAVVQRAMAKQPQDRYGSAAEMDRALEGALRTPIPTDGQTLVRAAVIPPRPASTRPGEVAVLSAASHRTVYLVAFLVLLAVVCVAVGMLLLPPPQVTVPSLVGLPLATARERAEAAGLKLEVAERRSDSSVDPDVVLEQRPAGGENLRRGEFVRVIVSAAPDELVLPDLVGKPEPQAVDALERMGLQVDLQREESLTVAAGKVIRSEPAAGSSVPRGSTVRLVISTGAVKKAVPNLVGMTLKQAEEALAPLGMTLVVNGTRQDATAPAENVLEQTPSAGTMGSRGLKVGVILSAGREGMVAPELEGKSLREAREIAAGSGLVLTIEGPAGAQDAVVFQSPLPGDPLTSNRILVRTNPSVVVPNLNGTDLEDARAQLEDLGLKLGEVRHVQASADPGEIVGQEPDTGIEVPRGTPVNLYVSDPDAPPLPDPVMTPVEPSPRESAPGWVPGQ